MGCSIYNLERSFIFAILWLAYGSCYLLRRPFGIIKTEVQNTLEMSDNLLGYMDFAFSLPYALVSLLLGFLGDSFGPRRTLGCGMLGSAVATSVMGRSSTYYELYILLFISGSFQSLCWPAACSILSSWFGKSNRSTVMAVYGSCFLVGNICGSFLTTYLTEKSGWRDVFAIPSLITLCFGITVLFAARQNRKTKKLEEDGMLSEGEVSQETEEETKSLSIWKVLRIPAVIETSLALLFTKGLKTAIMFWLPLYLMRTLNYSLSLSGLIPLTFEVGGLIGSIIIIFLFEKLFNISDLLMCTAANLLCGVAFLLMIISNKMGVVYLHILLFLTGAFSTIGDITLCGSFPSKIGEDVKAKSSVVGVINGVGSLGNVIEGPVISLISTYLGIEFLVPFFSLSCFLSLICTIRAHFKYKRIHKVIANL